MPKMFMFDVTHAINFSRFLQIDLWFVIIDDSETTKYQS